MRRAICSGLSPGADAITAAGAYKRAAGGIAAALPPGALTASAKLPICPIASSMFSDLRLAAGTGLSARSGGGLENDRGDGISHLLARCVRKFSDHIIGVRRVDVDANVITTNPFATDIVSVQSH